ncbi:hypothetical protein HY477_02560 [Candidatus Uhrbacteria bacterium]|nr:hypothetical protein [Candidatus Uhrbacteria bacterium]
MGDLLRPKPEIWQTGKGSEHRFKNRPRDKGSEAISLGDTAAFVREVLDSPDYERAADELSAVVEMLAELERVGTRAQSEDDLHRVLDLAQGLREKGEELLRTWPKLIEKLSRLQNYAGKLASARRGAATGAQDEALAVGGE